MTTLGDLKWHDRQIHLYLPITTIRCSPTLSRCKNFNSSGRDILYRYSKLDDKGTKAILANRQAYVNPCVHPYSLLPSRDIWTQLPSLLSCTEYHAVPPGQRVFACSSGEKAFQSTRYIAQQ